MRLEFTLTGRSGRRRDVVADVSLANTLRQVLASSLDPARLEAVYRGASPVDVDQPLTAGAVRSGARLSIGSPGEEDGWPLTGPVLAVLGGAAAGTFCPLGAGEQVVGRSAPADVVLEDPTISTRHASIRIADDGSLQVSDAGSSNGTFVRGVRLGGRDRVRVEAGERFVLGQAVVALLAAERPDGSVDTSPDGQALFNRVVRYRAPEPAIRISLPAPPPELGRSSIAAQLIGSVAMLAAGVVSALVLGNPLFALLGVIGPVVMMGTTLLTHRGTRRDAARRQRDYEQSRARAEQQLRDAANEEAEREWRVTADPARAALAALGPTSALWSVDGADETALRVRVGTHDRPARVTVQDAGTDAPAPNLTATPALVDLRTHPVLGIAGPIEQARGAARALVHQVVTSRSPEDLLVVHVSNEGTSDGWSWLRWLPHVRGMGEDVHTVSPGVAALNARLEELVALVRQRAGLVGFGVSQQQILPEVLVVLDGAGALRTRQAVVQLLQEGPPLGIRVLAIDQVPARLPAEATARLVVDPQAVGAPVAVLETRGGGTVHDITPDLVSTATAERTARAMAPLVPLGGLDGAGLPDLVRFVDLHGLERATPADVLSRWSAGEECRVVLGVDENGRPALVDLVADGPHALVAGTSGAGKSEALRALLAGLALSAGPADLSFLLVDFKGGGAFGKLAELPHVVGYADDLTIGGHLADRLLASLRAELDLRKSHFKAAGNVDGLAEYRNARRRRPELPPVSRLVIVVDEFAELKQAQPDFVDGLVNVARVGRSLGVHLVLATQQPAGVVTPQIRDNANLRICLRALDPGTSQDLVGSPVAATFPNRVKGRAAVLSGDGLPTVVQTAWVSSPVRSAPSGEVPPPHVTVVPWVQCGVADGALHRAEADTGVTDLEVLVRLIGEAADAAGAKRARRPWLPPLPERLLLDRLIGGARALPAGTAPFAVEDRPADQRQTAFSLTLGEGNLAFVGGRASGRSTALRTLAASAARLSSADDLHLYVIDQTPASVLRPLGRLPHTGVVATRTERHRTERLIARLGSMLEERGALLSQRGVSTLTELRRSDPAAPPYVVVLVDGWDQLVQTFSGAAEGPRIALTRLAEEGPALGIQLVVTGGRGVTRLLGSMEQVLVLPFEQRDDMAGFGVPVRELPTDVPAGRAHRPGSGNAVQIALLAEDTSTEAQNAALAGLVAAMTPAQRQSPFRLDDLPARIDWAEAAALPGGDQAQGRSVVVGVGGDHLSGRLVDLDRLDGPFVVAGPSGKGRTGALALICRQLTARDVPVLVVAGRPEDAARFPGARLVDPRSPIELVDGAVLLVDDAGRVPDDSPVLWAALEHPGVRVVLAGDPAALSGYTGWRMRTRAGGAGLLFSPKMGEGDLIGTTVAVDAAFSAGPGRAYLGLRGVRELVQVPWAG